MLLLSGLHTGLSHALPCRMRPFSPTPAPLLHTSLSPPLLLPCCMHPSLPLHKCMCCLRLHSYDFADLAASVSNRQQSEAGGKPIKPNPPDVNNGSTPRSGAARYAIAKQPERPTTARLCMQPMPPSAPGMCSITLPQLHQTHLIPACLSDTPIMP